MHTPVFFRVNTLLLCGFLLGACSSSETRDEQVDAEDMRRDSIEAILPDSVAEKDGTAHTTEAEKQASAAHFSEITGYQPGYSDRELSILDFTSHLQNPDSTVTDTDTICPVGQLHFWNIPAQNCRIFALGDAYDSPAPDLKAKCRVYGIQSRDAAAPVTYTGFLGIQLGEDPEEVVKRLDDFVAQNPGYTYEKVKGISKIEKFLNVRDKTSFVLTNQTQYYLFGFGKKKRLEYIIIANMNPRAAC